MFKTVAKSILALALLCSFIGSATAAKQVDNKCKTGPGSCTMRTCGEFCFMQGVICTCAQ